MKKLLALVLALVMTLSLCVTSNAAYKDAADVDLDEAVDVLTAVGVFQGDDNGNMNPKANLTREQAAKLVAYLQLGQKAADALVGGGKFSDVAKTAWSAGYVDYCASTGIVNGIGDGKFDPTGSLTALQFGKMLLVCLGYDAAIEGLTGADWTINTSKLMTSAKLLKGLDEVTAYTVVTREQAAQMMLNALKAPMVEYDNKGSTIAVNGATIEFGASKAEYVVATVAEDSTVKNIGKKMLTNSGAYTVELGEKLFSNLKLSDTTDDFARPAHQWYLKATKIGLYADTPDLTYTAAVKAGTIYTDLGLSKKITAEDIDLYVNGVAVGNEVNIAKGVSTKLGAQGNGVLTEVFYDDDNNTAVITQIVTYFGQVLKTVAATATKDTYVVVDTANVKPAGAAGTEEFETDEAFEDEAYVYYTFSESADEIKSLAVCEKVSGVVTEAQNKIEEGLNSQNVTIDGTKYKAGYAFVGEEVSSTMVKGEYDVYLDGNGYMLGIEEVSALSSNYALVLATSNNTNFVGKKAELLFADGTVKVVDTAKNYNSGTNAIAEGTIVTYRDDDGVYTLKEVATTVPAARMDGEDSPTAFVLKTNKNTVKVANTTVNTNSATQFVTYDDVDEEAAAYTGTKNAPSITATEAKKVSAYYYCKSGNMVTVMFILCDDAIVEGATNKSIFFARESRSNLISNNTGTYFEYQAVVNGEIKTVMVDDAVANASNLNGLYKSYTVNSKGVIISLNAYADGDLFADSYGSNGEYLIGTGIDKTSKDYTVTLDTAHDHEEHNPDYVITVDSNAAIYAVDQDGNITESSYRGIAQDANDLVFAYVDDYLVKKLFIQDVADDAVVAPSINAENYSVDYSTLNEVKVNYYTGAANDDNTLLEVIIDALKAGGYTNFTVNGTGTPHEYRISATKGYVTTIFTFDNALGTGDAVESYKVKVDGVSMLVATDATVDAAEGAGYIKVTDKNGVVSFEPTPVTTVADGSAYETNYVSVTFTTDDNDVTLSGATKCGDDLYAKLGATLVVRNSSDAAVEVAVDGGTAESLARNKSLSVTVAGDVTITVTEVVD